MHVSNDKSSYFANFSDNDLNKFMLYFDGRRIIKVVANVGNAVDRAEISFNWYLVVNNKDS